jgi:prepilin-type N-terminal cleavage/methylation domain-containing protein
MLQVGRSRARGNGRGFTLIELLVVVAIIGLLATAAVQFYFFAIYRARMTALSQDMEAVHSALMQYNFDHGSFPAERDFDTATLDPLTSEGYLRNGEAITRKLIGHALWVYVAPDIDGPDQQYILVARHEADPRVAVFAMHSNFIDGVGWGDGVYVSSAGGLVPVGDWKWR